MKTDYDEVGKKALAHLKSTTKISKAIQTLLLLELMRKNCHTVYGRKYEFESVDTIEEFQKRVPISTYEDYESYILQIIDGGKQVLTQEEAVYFCISPGSMGELKYLPLTEKDIMIHYLYAYGAVFGMVREFYGDLPKKEIFGKIFQIEEFEKNCMEDGRMKGIRYDSLYRWMERKGRFNASDYCAPREVLFPDDLEDLLYVKVRFALAERKISAIHGVFVNQVVEVMNYIYKNWDMLLKDMEQGSVDESVELSGKWKQFVRNKLPHDSARIQELRDLSYQELPHGMIRKIWPDIKYILAVEDRAFPVYMYGLKDYAGDVPIHYFAYAAPEGTFGIARKMNEPDAYILFPEAGFFEFLPLTQEGTRKTPYLMWEVSCGRQYELLFTNHSGLYRYRIGDVVEVIDWYGGAPVVKFYRKEELTI